MKQTHLLLIFGFILLFATACSPQIIVPPTAEIVETPTQIFIITATLPPTVTPFPTQTSVPPTATPPFEAVEGQTTSLVNVREAPSAASVQVGEVPIFDKIQIIGKDPSNKWWLIEFPASPSGQGWVTMEFVLVTLDTSRVPVVNSTFGTGQPMPTTESGENTGDAPVTAVPTTSFATAPEDGDSLEVPAKDVTLSEMAGTYIEHRSDLSAPEGDGNDWVQFVFDGSFGAEKNVTVIMNCTGSGKLNLELMQNDVPLQSWAELSCDRPTQLQLTLYTGAPYTLHFFTSSENGALEYIAYSVSVQLVK